MPPKTADAADAFPYLEPPRTGSAFRVVEFPPAKWQQDPEAKQILLGIIENCVSVGANDKYDGARSQAVNAMAELIRNQRLSRNERQQIKARFEALEPNATGQLKINLRVAIELITRMDTP